MAEENKILKVFTSKYSFYCSLLNTLSSRRKVLWKRCKDLFLLLWVIFIAFDFSHIIKKNIYITYQYLLIKYFLLNKYHCTFQLKIRHKKLEIT